VAFFGAIVNSLKFKGWVEEFYPSSLLTTESIPCVINVNNPDSLQKRKPLPD